MPWVNGVRAVVHAWYGGNETGNAIADLLYGEICPSGRLPLTFPLKEEDVPAFLSFKSGRTETHYEEGIWVGYKHYNARGIAPLFPFGHGLSYTSFAYDDLRIESVSPSPCQANDWSLAVAVTVTNTGTCGGSHSVHFYTAPPDPNDMSLVHPAHTFQAFSKTRLLAPGECERVHVELDKYAVSHWDEVSRKWRVEIGEWHVCIGSDAQTMVERKRFVIESEMEWKGL